MNVKAAIHLAKQYAVTGNEFSYYHIIQILEALEAPEDVKKHTPSITICITCGNGVYNCQCNKSPEAAKEECNHKWSPETTGTGLQMCLNSGCYAQRLRPKDGKGELCDQCRNPTQKGICSCGKSSTLKPGYVPEEESLTNKIRNKLFTTNLQICLDTMANDASKISEQHFAPIIEAAREEEKCRLSEVWYVKRYSDGYCEGHRRAMADMKERFEQGVSAWNHDKNKCERGWLGDHLRDKTFGEDPKAQGG